MTPDELWEDLPNVRKDFEERFGAELPSAPFFVLSNLSTTIVFHVLRGGILDGTQAITVYVANRFVETLYHEEAPETNLFAQIASGAFQGLCPASWVPSDAYSTHEIITYHRVFKRRGDPLDSLFVAQLMTHHPPDDDNVCITDEEAHNVAAELHYEFPYSSVSNIDS